MGETRDNIRKSLLYISSTEKNNVAFADRIGEKKQTVNNWLNGRNTPDIETIAKISEIYNIPVSAIFSGEAEGTVPSRIAKYVTVPLKGSIAAGQPLEMVEGDAEFEIPAAMHNKYPNAFLLRVKGESMNKAIPNGSYALINPTHDVHDGKMYAVCVNGHDATIKRVRKLNNGFELEPYSNDPTFESKTFNYNEPSTEVITVIGRVVWYCIPYDFDL